MSAFGFWDRMPIVAKSLYGSVSEIGYNAIDFLTGPHFGDDLARLERVCRDLPPFAKRGGGAGAVTLADVAVRMRGPKIDAEVAIEKLGGRAFQEYQTLTATLSRLVSEDNQRGSNRDPYVFLHPERDDIYSRIAQCRREINSLLAAVEGDLREVGSLEVLSFRVANLRSVPTAEYDEYLINECMKASKTPDEWAGNAPLAEDGDQTIETATQAPPECQRWQYVREIEFDSSTLDPAWLVDPRQSERHNTLHPFEEADLILFSIEKMAADPRCGLSVKETRTPRVIPARRGPQNPVRDWGFHDHVRCIYEKLGHGSLDDACERVSSKFGKPSAGRIKEIYKAHRNLTRPDGRPSPDRESILKQYGLSNGTK